MLTPNHLTLSRFVMSGEEGKDGTDVKEVNTKRSAENEETDDAKRKKVEQHAAKFSVSNCISLPSTPLTHIYR